MRKLLPYEYQLIQQLGISKEEYLEFLAVQAAYSDPKQGTVFDTRAELATVSIILTVVGALFQVASVLLAPKVKPPATAVADQTVGEPQTREQKFSPRFGFNSQQNLAKYGDPINLIYCNTTVNPKGAVRAATSLVWSAVRSYGSSQFVQLLFVLGAGRIAFIDPNKSAFGQVALEDLVAQNKFLYFNDQNTGVLAWYHERYGQAGYDPTFDGNGLNNPYRLQPSTTSATVDGFSQAYSPGTQNAFGVYGVVPINMLVFQRDSQGNKLSADLGIYMSPGYTGSQELAKDITIAIVIANTKEKTGDTTTIQAQEARRALSSVFDESGIFKLGSAVFKVISINVSSPDDVDMVITFRCIEAGFAPFFGYDVRTSFAFDPSPITNDLGYINAVNILERLADEDERLTGNNENGIRSFSFVEIMESDGVYKAGFVEGVDENGSFAYFSSYVKNRDFTQEERSAYLIFKRNTAITNKPASLFFTKALARAESASYRTIQQCNIVDFAIKSRVFKRVSGRQRNYGDIIFGYPPSDNGVKNRTAMFIFKYRKANQSSFTVAPVIIAVSRTADIDNFNYIKFASTSATADYWEFKLESIAETFAEIKKHAELRQPDGSTNFLYLENSPNAVTITLANVGTLQAAGRVLNNLAGLPPLNETPVDLSEWDLFNLDADSQCQFSFDSGPEFALTCVTEQQVQPFSTFPKLYNNLSMVGLNLYSGRNLQDLRSFTAFVTKGRVSDLIDGSKDCACHAPDIFLDTVVDINDGIGKYAKIEGVDLAQLAKSKRFCLVNKFFMDGVIADITSWRQFWVEVAPFSLLEFARIGGRETLIPAVPYDENTGAMNRVVNVKALFNQGNILESSYKEEHLDYGSNVQDIIATVIYRGADVNGTFSTNRAIEVRLADTSEADSIRQTFNTAQFVSTREQAVTYGKFLCQIRRHIKVAIEFKTFPSIDPISPGAFIYVDIGQNSWDGIRTGIVGPGGALNIPLDNSLSPGDYQFLLYKSGIGVISRTVSVEFTFPAPSINFDGSVIAPSLADLEGYLFVLGQQTTTRRIFRVTEVEMDEEGEITVRATNYPCTSDGLSKIADFSNNIFTVTGALD